MAFLSDIIKNTYDGDFVFIFAGTGSGKTTFAIYDNALSYLDNNETVLYLVPREILKRQIEKELRKIQGRYPEKATSYKENFQIWTYQYLETLLIKNTFIKEFDLIICDEFHYFITDATFNSNTQLSYNFIFKRPHNGVTMLITATPCGVMKYIREDKNFIGKSRIYNNCHINDYDDYDDDCDYNEIFIKEDKRNRTLEMIDNILKNSKLLLDNEQNPFEINDKTIYMYKLPNNYDYLDIKYITTDDDVIDIINNTNENTKTLVFTTSINKGEKLKKSLENNKIECIFINSENKNTVNKENVNKLVDTNTFNKKVLITTSVLDVGVNLLDANIVNIVIAANEPIEFLQMLGRVRTIQENQNVTLFIYARNAKYFLNLRDKMIVPQIECIEFLENYKKTHGNLNDILNEEYINNADFKFDFKRLIYMYYTKNKIRVKINKLAVFRIRQLYDLYDNIYNNLKKDEDSFIKLQLEWLGLKDSFKMENYYSNEIIKIRIENLYHKIEDKAKHLKNNSEGIFKDECYTMLGEFEIFVKKIDSTLLNGNNLSCKKFNHICKIYDIPYCIAKKQEKMNGKRLMKYYLLNINDKLIQELKLEIPK